MLSGINFIGLHLIVVSCAVGRESVEAPFPDFFPRRERIWANTILCSLIDSQYLVVCNHFKIVSVSDITKIIFDLP